MAETGEQLLVDIHDDLIVEAACVRAWRIVREQGIERDLGTSSVVEPFEDVLKVPQGLDAFGTIDRGCRRRPQAARSARHVGNKDVPPAISRSPPTPC